MLAALLAPGCASPPPRDRDMAVDPSLPPAERLRALAARESAHEQPGVFEVPLPPGVDRPALAPATSEDRRAWMSLTKALADLRAWPGPEAAPADAGSGRGDIDPVAQNAALRHYIKGREAALAERHYVAITELRRALELDPGAADARRVLAMSYAAMGNHQRALEQYDRLLEIEPHNHDALLTVALAAAGRREFARSAALLARLDGMAGDPGPGRAPDADILVARFAMTMALRHLGYDRASIELWRTVGDLPPEVLQQPSPHAHRLASILRQLAEVWRAAGDAHCRLGEYEFALEAYGISASHPAADPAALHPRVIYANLRLGRHYSAQRELLAALSANSSIGDRDVRLCEYVARHGGPVNHLAAAVLATHRAQPERADLARAAAALLPSDEARALLSDFLARSPDDLAAAAALLEEVGERDVREAVALTAALIEREPTLAGPYTARLLSRVPEPDALIAAARDLEPSPAAAQVHARLLAAAGASGQAWREWSAARQQWPEEPALAWLRIELALLLEEPALMAQAVDDPALGDDWHSWLMRSRALRALGRMDEAVDAAEQAATRAEQISPSIAARALAELAAMYATWAGTQPDEDRHREWAREAALTAGRALEADPLHEPAHELLLVLYGPGGPLSDAERFREVARALQERDPESRLYARMAAEEAINQGRYEQALERLFNLYDSDPHDTDALALIVAAKARSGRADEAMAFLDSRRAERPHDPAVLEQWVGLMVREQKTGRAITALEEMAGAEEHAFVARRLLESVYRATGRIDEAFPLGEQRLLSRPRGVRREAELAALYGGVGRDEDALEHVRYVLDHVEDATQEHLLTLVALLGRLRVEEAGHMMLDVVDATIERFPAAPLQVYAAGLKALAEAGRFDEAFDDLAERAVRHAPGAGEPGRESALVWREMAEALINAGHPAAAGRALRARIMAERPLSAQALNMLSTWAVVAWAAADGKHSEQSTEPRPLDAKGIAPAAAVVALLRELDQQGRLPHLLNTPPPVTLADTLFSASIIFTLVGGDGAEMLLEEVIELDPEHGTALNNLGYSRIERGRDDEQTIAIIERAIQREPDEAHVLDTVGWLRYLQGRLEDDDEYGPGALTYLDRALEAAEEPSAEVLDHLGDALWRAGQQDAAREAWEQAAEILRSPEHREVTGGNYFLLQQRGWGLLVRDPHEMYHQNYGTILRRLEGKLQALEDGRQPDVAPTFDEARRGAGGAADQ